MINSENDIFTIFLQVMKSAEMSNPKMSVDQFCERWPACQRAGWRLVKPLVASDLVDYTATAPDDSPCRRYGCYFSTVNLGGVKIAVPGYFLLPQALQQIFPEAQVPNSQEVECSSTQELPSTQEDEHSDTQENTNS